MDGLFVQLNRAQSDLEVELKRDPGNKANHDTLPIL